MSVNHPSTTRHFLFSLFLFVCCLPASANQTQRLLITELLALNSKGLTDEDGDTSDWIELYNPGETTVNLAGWSLTDKMDEPRQWVFPACTLNPGEYLLVFASGKDRRTVGHPLHTNFKLSGGGEYLALIEPEGLVAHAYDPFPPQQTDVSYGLYLDQASYFLTPTPGEGNSLGSQVQAPLFSLYRGFYSEPISVALSVTNPGTTIRYTTDGTRPSATHGHLYTQPLTIRSTTPLSAVSVNKGLTSDIVTHTYLFIDDIMKQPARPAGYPDEWGNYSFYSDNTKNVPADYEMDPEVCNHPQYAHLLPTALQSLPTLCIVTNPGYLFSHSIDPDTGGIYIYTGDVRSIKDLHNNPKLGADWERPTSVEYFDPRTGRGFQINCGLRLHGGNSRKAMNSPKHSFRLSFRKEYGASKLNYTLFEEKGAAERFDHLVVRSTYNYSWIKDNSNHNPAKSQYLNDQFAKQLHRDMGHISPHERPIHLYINGLYWGVYKLAEKINNDFISEYLPGDDDDFDVINDDWTENVPEPGIVDGNDAAYKLMRSFANNGEYDALIEQQLLDMDNYIDYMLMNYYIGNQDWDGNNFFAIRNRVEPGQGFIHLTWDAETTMADVNFNLVKVIDKELTKRFDNLSKNADFKLRVADRMYRHFFNDGVLTPAHTVPTYRAMADEIDTAMVAESARWGDYVRDVKQVKNYPLYTLNDHWLPRRNELLQQYLPRRTDIVLNQLKDVGYWPSIEPPVFNSRGGAIVSYVDLTMTATKGTIFYTVDGSDPRRSGSSSIAPGAREYTTQLRVFGPGTIKARAKEGNTWSALAELRFTGGDNTRFVVDQSKLTLPDDNHWIDVFTVGATFFADLSTAGHLRIDVYALDGRHVATPVDGWQAAGRVNTTVTGLTPLTLYLYRATFKGVTLTGKLMQP